MSVMESAALNLNSGIVEIDSTFGIAYETASIDLHVGTGGGIDCSTKTCVATFVELKGAVINQ
jgi:hypothetical protein